VQCRIAGNDQSVRGKCVSMSADDKRSWLWASRLDNCYRSIDEQSHTIHALSVFWSRTVVELYIPRQPNNASTEEISQCKMMSRDSGHQTP